MNDKTPPEISSGLVLSPDELSLWRGFRKMAEAVQLQVARDLGEFSNLSRADFAILSRLAEAEGQAFRQQELADSLHWEKSRLSHQLTRMKQNDLVERHKPSDGKTVIRITETGKQKLALVQPFHAAAVRKHLIDKLSPEQIAAVRSLIDRLL